MKKKVLIGTLLLLIAVTMIFAGCKKDAGEKLPDKVGVVNGEKVTVGMFLNMFQQSLAQWEAAAGGEVDFGELEGSDTTAEDIYEFLVKERADGTSYYDAVLAITYDNLALFMANLELAKAADCWPTDEEIQKNNTSIESSLRSYISYYGFASLNKACEAVFQMPLAEYKALYSALFAINQYNTAEQEKMEPAAEVLEQFYKDHEAQYRIVKVRHCLLMTQNLSEEKKQKQYELAQSLIEKVASGEETMDHLVKEYSEDTGVSSNNGYYEVTSTSSFVKPFLDWAVKQTEPSETLEIVESSYGYHIMQCTEIKAYDSEDVQKNVLQGYKDKEIDKMLEEKVASGDYEMKNPDAALMMDLVKKSIAGDFGDDYEEPSASASPGASPAPATPVEYNDDPLSTEYVAKLGDETIWYSEYSYFLYSALQETDFSSLNLSEIESEEEQNRLLKEFLASEYQDGVTYMEHIKDRTLELCVSFKVTKIKAYENGHAVSEEDLKQMNSEIDSYIDQYLSYYGQYYNYTTRDEMCNALYGMGVNDYKRFAAEQKAVSAYAEARMDKMEPAEEALLAHYHENLDQFRVVTVRQILRSTTDEDGETVSDEKKAEVRAMAESILKRLEDPENSAQVVAQAYSESTTVSTDYGLIDFTAGSAKWPEMKKWALQQTEVGAKAIIETSDGYHVVICEGITEYDKKNGIAANSETTTSEKIQEAVKESYLAECFDKEIKDLITAENYTAADLNADLMQKAIDDFFAYDKEEEK